MALSPMMQQYLDIKDQNKDCILFFRLGDFYEMFFDDAKLVSKELELTLTGKNCGLEERAPMCGVPFHSADSYIARLIEKGYKVAVCEQVEDPKEAKGLVKREIVQIVTPGTVTSSAILHEDENNYLASVYVDKTGTGFSYCDVSTGEINVTEFSGRQAEETLLNELARIDAKEIIINEKAADYINVEDIGKNTDTFMTELNRQYYNEESLEDAILKQFEAGSLVGLGLDGMKHAANALGAQLLYLAEMQRGSMGHMKDLNVYRIGNRMALDKATIRNLEITETIFEHTVKGSLLGVLDRTNTAMGSRKMKQWLREPLNNVGEINERLDAVEELVSKYITRNNIRESLKAVYDFERLAGRISTGNANAKDLIALRNSLAALPEIKYDLEDSEALLLQELNGRMDALEDVYRIIDDSIIDDPPFTVKEGGIIREGYSKELDDLKNSIADAKDWIASLESHEKERTGITHLKVGFNKVFGYYIEISRSELDKTPEDYIRKQTLVGAERFITPELKEMEGKVLNAETKINNLEYDLFREVRDTISGEISRIQKTSRAVSTLDVLCSFAEVSDRLGYVRPEVNGSDAIIIEKGRHPVIEQTAKDGVFVPNDTYMDKSRQSLLLITGPNMSGKSTYMRQTAIIVLMAQSGCFVPCERAVIGIVDRIFTRIGASDNLSQGQSTFFLEMSELAYILNTATPRSLIILDEIGRGTSTYDGLSIAWAVVKYLCDEKRMIRTLFASHYHELTEMEGEVRGFKNLNVDVAEQEGDIIFLHKIVEGSASRSYGIHVAKLAGVPKELLESANTKLRELEEKSEAMNDKDGIQMSFRI
ncbi:MAG: DNA mismatch repair protein MutS [Anaerovoracaceae bacterium]|jgi:DNA mismatch repair protein MutS